MALAFKSDPALLVASTKGLVAVARAFQPLHPGWYAKVIRHGDEAHLMQFIVAPTRAVDTRKHPKLAELVSHLPSTTGEPSDHESARSSEDDASDDSAHYRDDELTISGDNASDNNAAHSQSLSSSRASSLSCTPTGIFVCFCPALDEEEEDDHYEDDDAIMDMHVHGEPGMLVKHEDGVFGCKGGQGDGLSELFVETLSEVRDNMGVCGCECGHVGNGDGGDAPAEMLEIGFGGDVLAETLDGAADDTLGGCAEAKSSTFGGHAEGLDELQCDALVEMLSGARLNTLGLAVGLAEAKENAVGHVADGANDVLGCIGAREDSLDFEVCRVGDGASAEGLDELRSDVLVDI